MSNTNKSSDSLRIRTYFAIGVGLVGSVLLVLGLIFSAFGFSSGVGISFNGLVTIAVVVIIYVLSTDGADTEMGPFSGAKFP